MNYSYASKGKTENGDRGRRSKEIWGLGKYFEIRSWNKGKRSPTKEDKLETRMGREGVYMAMSLRVEGGWAVFEVTSQICCYRLLASCHM